MKIENGRRKFTPLILSMSVLLPVQTIAAADFEIKSIESVRPFLGQQGVKTMPQLDFTAIPGLNEAIKSPITIELTPTDAAIPAIPTLPSSAYLESAAIESAASFQAPDSGAQAAAAGFGEISKQISTELDAAGPIANAADGDAADLGGRIQRTLGAGDDSSGPTDPAAPSVSGQTPDQNEKLATLKQVVRIFTEHYAPIEWKQSHRGVDFVAEYQKARAKVLAKPGMTQHEFQGILADFVAASQDYHASIGFYSTEKASLPIMILSANGKHYIAYVDRSALPSSQFPYEPGDEVVKFGSQDVGALADSFTKVPNTVETDARLAEMHLTNRSRRSGSDVPQGKVELTIRTANGAVHAAKLDWNYQPEMIPTDVPTRGPVLGPETDNLLNTPGGLTTARKAPRDIVRNLLQRFVPSMAHPMAGPFSELAAANPDNGFMIGGKKTFVPDLGKVVWELPAPIAAQVPFVVKIYQNAAGQRIGYLRIPDYMGGGNTDQASQLLEKLVEKLQAETDGLVIDQVNNPGGDMFFMNDVASMLTDKPLTVAKHRLMIDESDAALAAQILQQANDPGVMQEMEDVLNEMMAGFQSSAASMIKPLVDYANFILSELKAGRRLTNPTYIFGVQKIEPNANVRYTKPVIVLINELDFSAADFFAAVMQDNKRGTLFGVRTSGAGGAVKEVEFPNQFGIEHVAYTWTIAMRPIGKPIENLGVQPDVNYQITPDDLRTGFSGYGKALGDVIAKLFPTGTAGGGGTMGDGTGDDAPQPPKRTPRRPRSKPE